MPTVEFSPQQLSEMCRSSDGLQSAGIFGTNGVNGYYPTRWTEPWTTVLGDNNNGTLATKIVLFSSVMPSQPRLMTSSSMSSSLVYFNTPNDCSVFNVSSSGVEVTTYLKTAYATGTATWFAWCTYYNNSIGTVNPPATNGTLTQRIIGTVGTVGSGADLEISSTSIVSGGQYRIYNLRIALPSSYTY